LLVLSRTEGSKFYLIFGETRVEVEIVEIRQGPVPKARIGVTAPDWIHIERDDMKCGAKPSMQNIQRPEED
jgi:sRNA-binding carbon storage regulator CsrA